MKPMVCKMTPVVAPSAELQGAEIAMAMEAAPARCIQSPALIAEQRPRSPSNQPRAARCIAAIAMSGRRRLFRQQQDHSAIIE